jgi:transcriptional regulator with GAF, ATPase, and Fis domain
VAHIKERWALLDEVGEIALDLQAKLLRVLQEEELEQICKERTREWML